MIALFDSTNQVSPLLQPKLRERLPDAVLEFFSSFGSLRQRLSRMNGEAIILILMADSRGRLEQFKELQNLYADFRIVLILPDSATETVNLGHQLYPRFVSYREGNIDNLVSVVARMHTRIPSYPGG